ncbi:MULTISPECIES: HIT domain-containing protein [unclassified Clostridium]|uniref:HIT family protein n=1 Tax=unclassified Clostridium TaxID=2614128 RepID=UPI000297AE2E|nr:MULTISPECIES: HIT domain-containing protein [unclassified Clostridium]EKQ51427.1 MAG: HIT family hydrolase, diadenosine tetraphosphate hydrolase [Clostridium sp. Maddingley MBC34-26]
MNSKINCLYCYKDEKLDNLMIEICKLNVSTLYLFKEQSHKGRCIVAYNKHVNELFELEEKELELFMKDVTRAAAVIKKSFSPDKVNYGAYSDTLPHLHFHLVPKYKDAYSWGGVFEMNPQKVYLSDEEYKKRIDIIKENLKN